MINQDMSTYQKGLTNGQMWWQSFQEFYMVEYTG